MHVKADFPEKSVIIITIMTVIKQEGPAVTLITHSVCRLLRACCTSGHTLISDITVGVSNQALR